MADPPTTPSTTVTTPAIVAPTPEQNQAWSDFANVTTVSGQSLGTVGDIGVAVGDVFAGLNAKLSGVLTSFGQLDSMTDEQSRKFGVLTTSIIGARKAFTEISGVDTSRLVTYTDQFAELVDILRTGPGTQMAADAIQAVIGKMTDLGASSDTIRRAQAELKQGVMNTAAAFFQSADNISRLQNSMLQMTIAGGGATALFEGLPDHLGRVGSDLQNLDAVTKQYNQTLERGAAALGGSKRAQELAAGYMAQISRMPDGLNLLLRNTEIAGKGQDLLTASMNIASGAGMKEEDVLKGINTVLRNYRGIQDNANETAGAGADLMARMGILAGDFQVDINDVNSALTDATTAFSGFVMKGADVKGMTQGMADAMQDYVEKLESVGVPGENAVAMFKQYTQQMANMTTGQRAFLSQMSGGPGGLRGAFQMENLIRTNPEELRRRVEESLKKLTGPIVSFEDAQKSEGAAEQYQRQIMILQQGPLGAMAKRPEDAEAILKAMKEGTRLPGTGKTDQQQMQDLMKRGEKIQKDSYTQLVDINQSLNTLVLRAGEANKATTRQVLGTGNPGAMAGGVGGTGAGITPNANIPGLIGPASQTFKHMEDVARNLPKSVADAWKSLKEAIMSGNRESVSAFDKRMQDAIRGQKAAMGKMSEDQKQAMTVATTTAAQVQEAMTNTAPTAPPPRTTTTGPTPPTTTIGPNQRTISFTPTDSYTPRGRQVAAAVPPATQAGVTTTGPGTRGGGGGGTTTTFTHATDPNRPVPVTLASGSALTLNFTCPNCGNNVRQQSLISDTASPPAGQRH